MRRSLLPTRAVLAPLLVPITPDVSNCPFLIFCASSMPVMAIAAFLNLLNPSIG